MDERLENRVANRLAWSMAVVLVLVAPGSMPEGRCDDAPLAALFAQEPEAALIRRLDPGQVPSETTASDPATGLAVTQKRRSFPRLRCVLLETTLTNRGAQPLPLAALCAGDWSFRLGEGEDSLRYRDLTFRNDLWYGSAYWTGPDWTRVGKDWHHPGENTPSVRRFVAPRDGRVTISGRVRKAHLDKTTDGVRLAIRHGRRDVWTAEIAGDDAQGVEPKLSLDVRQGDAVRFVVHKRGLIACDTTYWDPVVTYADGQSFQASRGFTAARQPGNPWFYEMEADGQTKIGWPCVHGFWRDGGLRQQITSPERPVVLTDRDALPVLVLADGTDQSGVLLAVLRPDAWQATATLTGDGRLCLRVSAGDGKPPPLAPGQSLSLPPLVLGAYQGSWLAGMAAVQQVLVAEDVPGAAAGGTGSLSASAAAGGTGSLSASGASPPGQLLPEFDYWAMIQADWHRQDKLADTADSFAEATARQIAKTRLLRADLGSGRPGAFLAAEARQLDELARQSGQPGLALAERRALYLAVRNLKRRIALANPLLDFSKLVFSKRVPTSYSHLVMQYFGWRARPGGGLFVLEKPGRSLACRDVTGGKLAGGSVLEPRLSWDARRVVFSFVQVTGEEYDPAQLQNDRDAGFFHVWEVGVDGTGLRQLTSGPYDDLMPAYLPDGGIVFSSTRRRGYARCFGGQFSPRWHVYTLHRMDGDGQNLRCLSFHDTNEWFPAVLPSGLIAYARWDYIDRDAVTHQNLWTTRPDGTNPVALWGNATPTPHCSFQVQPIAGTGKLVCTASAHHSITAGSIAVIDPAVARDGQRAVTRITPEIPFPEAEGMSIPEYYEAPWPLGEKYFLVGYSPVPLVWEPGANPAGAVGIYLLDAAGNRELIYRDPAIGSTNPCPLVPRPVPPVIPKKGSDLFSGRSLGSAAPDPLWENSPDPFFGEVVLMDVYRGLGSVPGSVPRGTIKEVRVVQIFPKTTHVAGAPLIGLAGEENGRAILGTVPVEPDGSARFLVPACKPILFQALDADGLAYQTMRTVTYLQPGETASCTGCHEDRMTAPVRPDVPAMALRRGPSRLAPGPMGGRPFSFVEMVQPVLDRHCVRCHGAKEGAKEGSGVVFARPSPPSVASGIAKTTPVPFVAPDLTARPEGPFTRSYLALCSDRNFWGEGTNSTNAAEALVPRFGARNQLQRTEPGGRYGARGSRLVALVRKGHYDAKLTPDDLRRLAAWIDLNAIFYGTNDPAGQARQLRGEPVAMPEIQ